MTAFRIGQGFDVHAFGEGDSVVLGGVRIPHSAGLIAHSDGDVVLHALCDALLGSVALGDIGKHFPDDDKRYAGIDSRELLRQTYQLIIDRGYTLVNTDITVIAQVPKIAPHVTKMRQNIADDLNVEQNAISVKATTSERLGFTGREEGIAVQATVLIQTLTV